MPIGPSDSNILRRIRQTALPLAGAAVLFLVLSAGGFLPPHLAALSFALVAALVLTVKSAPASGALAPLVETSPAEAALLTTVIRALPDAAVLVDDRETVLAFNATASHLAHALRLREPLSRAWRNPALLAGVRRAVTTKEPQRIAFSDPVPADCFYEVHIVQVPRRGQNPALLLLFHDLSPLRRAEEMRADFVANVSHELRTPLASLCGFIETLQGPARNDAGARERFLSIMQSQATRMARLIDDLLSLSRIEFNAHVRPNTLVDLAAIVRQVADSLQTLAQDRAVTVELIVPPAAVTVRGDRDELVRVVENLLENALKYGAPGKRAEVELTVDAQSSPPEARLAVSDWGSGIAPEHLPRLTERFYRVDVTRSRAEGGTGLGLALVKHILNRHGGHLTIESVQGAGATFVVHLPLPEAS